jgi:tetratricopeptide (TPR) repeat protein
VLALSLDAQGRGDEAVAELRKLPADLPLSAEVALRLAATEAPDEGIETALQRIERALELAPGDPQLVQGRELLLAERAREREARAPRRDGEDLRAHLHYLRARVLFENGRTEESRRALDQALASPGGDAGEWRAEAESLRKQLDAAVSPQGAHGKDFSSIHGKLFPRCPRERCDDFPRDLEIFVISNTCGGDPLPRSLAPELHSQPRPNRFLCRGLS